ncbi:hypothetical protein K440DRAFT_664489 [Wilcoxina mikolae CBS 423.85]|nr:hypothetical protein K440DRAFT_664489 [Wilcoxina mikolae CBS 423.85]
MRIFTFAAMAALAAAKVVPSPKITPANTTPDRAQTSPEITPAPTHPPLFEAYRELLKRSANATPAFKKRPEAPCPVDCGNGFCCPLNQKCFSEKDSKNQVSMQCGYPELRKRQYTDWNSLISSIYAHTDTTDYSAYYSSLLSEIYAFTTDPYYSSLFADPYYSSILASLTMTDYVYGTRTRGSDSQATDSSSYSGSGSYSHSSRRKKKSPVGAIVGGVIGGLLFLALIAGIIFFVIRRNKKTPQTPQAFVSQQAQAPKPQATYPLQPQTPAPAPVPEKAFYQSAQPAVPGAVEADGTQAVPPQYMGNSQQYPQQPIQQQFPQQLVQQQQYPQQPMQQQQQYPQQPIQQQQYPQQQQQQNFQQPGAVYHEVHNTSSPPPQGYQNYPPPPPVSPPPQQQYATPIPQPGTVYHEMGTGPA